MRKLFQSVAVWGFALFAHGAMPALAQSSDGATCSGNDFSAAISACTRLLGQRSLPVRDRATAYGYRANAYRQKGDYDRAITDYDEAIRLDPRRALAYLGRGFAYSWKRDYDRAIRDYDDAIRFDSKLAVAYNSRGGAYNEKGDYDRAIRDLDEAIRLNPKDADAYNKRGIAYHWKRDFDRAIRDYDEAISVNPKLVKAYQNRGALYRQKGDHDRAIRDLDEAIRLDPKNGVFYNDRGLAYAEKHDYDRAIRDYDEGIRLNPTNAVTYHNRGLAYAEKQDYDHAIRDYDEAIRLNPKLVLSYKWRGFAYQKKADYDRAIHDYDEAIRLDPTNASAYHFRASAYSWKNDFDASIRDLNEAIRLDPKNVRSYVNRSLAHKQKGNLNQAYRDVVEALALNPSDAGAKAQQEKLRSLMAAEPIGKAGPAISSAQPIGPRIALVIGNGNYRFAPELANPLNDARDISAALRELGFKVVEGYNLDGAAMRAKIAEFGSDMPGAATTVLFYAGHGIQVAGKNYLIPIDAKLERPSALGVEAMDVDTILADMETERRTNLVFLDACRDNPLSRSLARSFGETRSATVGQGLAQLNAGIGTLITFATSPNTVALDGTGRNSPFTTALLRHIRTPDLEVRTMLTRVRADVVKATNDRQLPWDHSSLLGEFYFKRGG